MNVLDQFTRETVELSTATGDTWQAPGWRYREFHVREAYGGWNVSHLPTGFRFPVLFDCIEKACAAAVELDALRNQWRDLTKEDMQTMRDRAWAIFKAHDGRPYTGNVPPLKAARYPDRLNGYAEARS